MKTNEMKTVFVNDIMVSEDGFKEEAEYISNLTDIPYDTVLSTIKGIDAYYYLMGMQDEPTFEDEYEMFIDGSIQPRKYDPDYVIDDEMLAFISSHTDIPDEIIESVMVEDFKYQYAYVSPIPVIQRTGYSWSEETKAALLCSILENLHEEQFKPSNACKYNTPMSGRKSIDHFDIKIRL